MNICLRVTGIFLTRSGDKIFANCPGTYYRAQCESQPSASLSATFFGSCYGNSIGTEILTASGRMTNPESLSLCNVENEIAKRILKIS